MVFTSILDLLNWRSIFFVASINARIINRSSCSSPEVGQPLSILSNINKFSIYYINKYNFFLIYFFLIQSFNWRRDTEISASNVNIHSFFANKTPFLRALPFPRFFLILISLYFKDFFFLNSNNFWLSLIFKCNIVNPILPC